MTLSSEPKGIHYVGIVEVVFNFRIGLYTRLLTCIGTIDFIENHVSFTLLLAQSNKKLLCNTPLVISNIIYNIIPLGNCRHRFCVLTKSIQFTN